MDAIYLNALSNTVRMTVLLVVIPCIVYFKLDFPEKPLLPRILMVGVPAVIVAVLWLGMPSRQAMRSRYRVVFQSSVEDMKRICLLPEYPADSGLNDSNLVSDKRCEVSRNSLERVVAALRSARPFMPKRHGIKWSCKLDIQSDEERVTIDVDSTRGSKTGVLVYVRGGLLGRACYRCDALGGVLEDLAWAGEVNP